MYRIDQNNTNLKYLVLSVRLDLEKKNPQKSLKSHQYKVRPERDFEENIIITYSTIKKSYQCKI